MVKARTMRAVRTVDSLAQYSKHYFSISKKTRFIIVCFVCKKHTLLPAEVFRTFETGVSKNISEFLLFGVDGLGVDAYSCFILLIPTEADSFRN